MAKFKVGEKARYVGSQRTSMPDRIGGECTVIDPLAVRDDYSDLLDPGMPRYGIRFTDGAEAWVKESSLEKLIGKHQPDDLKAAEPQFIHHQLPRWLTPEKKRESEKAG